MNQTIEKILNKHLSGGYGAFRAIHEEIMAAIDVPKPTCVVEVVNCKNCLYVEPYIGGTLICTKGKMFRVDPDKVAKQCPLRESGVTIVLKEGV